MTGKWITALLLSVISYLTVLFAIIVFDTFLNSDFNFSRVIMISVPFIAILIVYLIIMLIFFKITLD